MQEGDWDHSCDQQLRGDLEAGLAKCDAFAAKASAHLWGAMELRWLQRVISP
jgi:hypothetical protein